MSHDLDKYLHEAITNIRRDRETTNELLSDVIKALMDKETSHREIGLTAAKYVETLQRSNEQLVKVANIVAKRESEAANVSLTDDDKDSIFDMIQSEPHGKQGDDK